MRVPAPRAPSPGLAPAWGSSQEAGTRREGAKTPAWAGGREARDGFPVVPLGPPCPPPTFGWIPSCNPLLRAL